MEDKTQNDISEYIKKLPQKVQNFVFDGEWEKRTLEIAKKYSLSDVQSDALANIVVLVLIGIEKPDTFLQTVVGDLAISQLLAENIIDDLQTRVFEYALSQMEPSKPVVTQVKPVEPQKNAQVPAQETQKVFSPQTPVQNKIPEVRPITVPMVEKQPPVLNRTVNEPVKAPVPRYVPPASQERVQQPVPVPRFTSEPIVNTPPVVTNPTPQNSIQNKLNSVVKGPSEPVSLSPKAPEKYSVDPYREPIN